MRISVGPEDLTKLLSGGTKLEVPSFQRNFSWGRNEIDQFIDDLIASGHNKEPHFYGPIVFLRQAQSGSDTYQVIDGQQRLTSAMMLLSLLRDRASALKDKTVGTRGAPIDTVFRSMIFLPPLYDEPKYRASYLIEKIFRDYILEDPITVFAGEEVTRKQLSKMGKGLSQEDRTNSRELRRAYWDMKRRVDREFDGLKEDKTKDLLQEIFWALSDGFQIHSMVLDNEDDAYILFETLNDRGLRLSPSDLLKTITLREIRANRPNDLEEALKKWDETTQNLGEYDFSKFLRHHLLTIEKTKVQKPKILGTFKKLIASSGSQGATKNLDKLYESSLLYGQLLGVDFEHPDKHIAASCHRMNSYSETHRVFLLAVLEKQGNFSIDVLRKLFRAAEFLSFRWIAALQNAQVLENHYQNLLHKLKNESSNEFAESLIDEMVELAPSDERIGDFSELDNSSLQKYLLRRIEESYGGNFSKWSETLSLEHLAPRNPRGDQATYWNSRAVPDPEISYADVVAMVGNLTLLEGGLNSSIQDSMWAQKLFGSADKSYEGISSSNFNINKPLMELDDWNYSMILERSKWIHDCALQLVGKEWLNSGKVKINKWQPTKT